jgi:hypothetical protein
MRDATGAMAIHPLTIWAEEGRAVGSFICASDDAAQAAR